MVHLYDNGNIKAGIDIDTPFRKINNGNHIRYP